MRTLITDIDLNTTLSQALNNNLLYTKKLYTCASMQFMTGCRANDVLKFNNWTLLGNGNLQLQPQKNNLLRIFEPSEVNNDFYNAIVENESYLDGLFYRKYQYYMEKILHTKYFKINDKPVSTHLFRYNYARQMKANGFTDVQIKEKLGERQLSSAQAYIYSQITWEI